MGGEKKRRVNIEECDFGPLHVKVWVRMLEEVA